MNKGKLYTASLAVVVGLFLAGCSAMMGVEPGPSVSSAPSQVASAIPAGGPQEGIKVHGHWLIEVRNPDGSLASRREFENAYSDAFGMPAKFLSRANSPGFWLITLNASGFNLCGTSFCMIAESVDPAVINFGAKTLAVKLVGSTVQLKGNVTIIGNDTIISVETAVGVCPANTAPATACSSNKFGITSTILASPVNVVAGQQVQVTVTLSFS